jgi:hypothetical protein
MGNKFQTNQVVARAVVAYRTNGKIVKYSSIDTETHVKTFSNKELMLEITELSDSDLTEAEGLINFLQQTQMLSSLTSARPNKFLDEIVALLNQPQLDKRDFGIMAWVPKLSEDLTKQADIRHKSQLHAQVSNFVGTVGAKLEVNFSIINTRYVKSMDCWMVYGHGDDDNLYNYWANSESRIISGKITGKVKRHLVDSYHGDAKVTQLNYVKVAK